MTTAKTKTKPTKAQLQRKVVELEAQLASTLHFADHYLDRAGTKSCTGSAVLIRLTALGGQEIGPPFAIRDGLSPATIAALREDIRRSYEVATLLKPQGVP